MGLKDSGACKSYLRTRLPRSFLNNYSWLNEHQQHSGKVSVLVLDFLLHIHQIAHSSKLSFEMVQKKLKNVFINFIASFPRLHTMVILLDEQEYTPLGKVPTQQTRSDSLTMEERSTIIEGGVLEKVDHTVLDSIEEAFKDHPDVVANKKNAFAVFFSKYVRTRALRKDMMRLITNTLIDLVEEKRIPYGLRVYIDGISYATYYAPSSSFFHTEEGQDMSSSMSLSLAGEEGEGASMPMLKRRKSISAVADVHAHSHAEDKYIRLCKLDINTNEDDETVVKPVWFTKEEQDSDIFGGFDGGIRRGYMGESDVKIPYYLWKIATMMDHQLKEGLAEGVYTTDPSSSPVFGMTVYISSWDSDCIPLTLFAMNGIYQAFTSLYPCHPDRIEEDQDGGGTARGERRSPCAVLRVLLDGKQGGSCWDLEDFKRAAANGDHEKRRNSKKKKEYSLNYDRFVSPDEDEYLTEVIDVGFLTHDAKVYFSNFYPVSRNPVETLCTFLMCGGTDFVRSIPGVGFSTLRAVFDAGGYLLLSEAISPSCERSDTGLVRSFRINESCLLGFYNLCIRYALSYGSMGKVSTEITSRKKTLRSKINKTKKVLDELRKSDIPADEEGHTHEQMEEAIDRMEKKREFLDYFLWKDHYVSLLEVSSKMREDDAEKAEEELANYLGEISGMDECEHEDWDNLHGALRKKKQDNVKKTRDAMKKKHKKAQDLIQKLSEDETKWTQAQSRAVTTLIGAHSLSGKEAIAKLRVNVVDPQTLSDADVYATRRASITDISGLKEVKPLVRTLVWSFIYWNMAPFFCIRDSKTLRSTRVDEGEEAPSVFGFKSGMREHNGKRKRTVLLADAVSPGKTITVCLK
jgi:hypothetical protein